MVEIIINVLDLSNISKRSYKVLYFASLKFNTQCKKKYCSYDFLSLKYNT